ncbi:MAG: PAS domain S-box protein [Pseudomonadota bacterium]
MIERDQDKSKEELIEEVRLLRSSLARVKEEAGQARLARDALMESERRFRQMADNIEAVFWVNSPDDGTVLYVSNAYEKIFGLSVRSLYQNPQGWIELVHPDDLTVVRRLFKERREGKRERYEYRIIRPDGETRWIHSRTFPVFDEKGGISRLAGVALDITRRKDIEVDLRAAGEELERRVEARTAQLSEANSRLKEEVAARQGTEAELVAANQQLQGILSNSSSVIFLKDVRGRYRLVNKKFEELWGRTAEEARGRTPTELFSSSAAEKIFGGDEEVLERKKPITGYETIMIKDENRTFVTTKFPIFSPEGDVTGICGIATEVTELKRAEEALRDSEDRFRKIVETAHEGVCVVDSNARVAFVNPAMSTMFGYEPEEALGRPVLDFMDEDAGPQAMARIERRKQGLVDKYDFRFKTKDGRDLWAIVSASPIFSEDRRYQGVLCMITDITERKKAEEALLEREQQYHALFDNNHSVMFLINPETGRIVDANPAACGFYGFDKETLISKEFSELGTQSKKEVFSAMTLAKTERKRQFLFRHRLSSGEIRDVEAFSGPITVGGRRLLYSIIHDITERKEAEENLIKRTKELALRVKELNCLFEISKLVEREGLSFESLLSKIVDILPPAWLFPEIARARLVLDEKVFLSRDFQESPWKLTARVWAGGEVKGWLEVFYLEERPVSHEGPFLLEERNLIDAVAERLGLVIERKVSRTALEESAEFKRVLFEILPMGLAITDDRGRVIEVNPAAEEILNIKPFGFMGTSGDLADWLVVRADGAIMPLGERAEIKALREGQVIAGAGQGIVGPDGRVIWLDVTAAPLPLEGLGVAVVCVDVTEKKLAEEERARLAAAVDQASESIVIFDSSGRIIQYVNPAFERLTGYPRGEAIGAGLNLILGRNKDGSFYRKIYEAISQGRPWSGRTESHRKDGNHFDVETTLSPVRDMSGRVINILSIGRDVTRESVLERQLQQSQKMEAIGVLAGGIAHDFNNILWAITGFAEMSLEEAPPGGEIQDNLVQLLKAVSRAKDLVEQILVFSRQSGQEKETLVFGPLVREALKLIRASLPTTIEIRQVIPDEDLMVWANATQIHQVLMNLCSNAGHAMREKGGVLTVSISAMTVETGETSPHTDMSAGPYVMLTVADTGHGMDRWLMERIFEPFFTTKNPVEGTGMGLAAVHGILKSHGGVATVDSEPGQGAVFRVYLPRVIGRLREEEEEIEEIPLGDERILLVDDESVLVDMAARMLGRLGYEVAGFSSSLKAWEAFEADSDKFDLVITDQTMPGLTGVELSRRIMARRPDLPIILCTGYSKSSLGDVVDEVGVRALTFKPLVMSQIARLIREVLDGGVEES